MVSIEKHSWTRWRHAMRSMSPRRFMALAASSTLLTRKPVCPSFDYFTARAEVHGDYGHAGSIGFHQDQSKSFRDGVQVQQRSGIRKQLVLTGHVHWPDVSDRLSEVGLHLLAEVGPILDNTRDEQRQPAQASRLDRQMDTLVRVNPAEEDQVISAKSLDRVQGEVDSVIHRGQIIQTRCAIGVADGDKISVTILLIHGHDFGRRESVDGREDWRLHQTGIGQRHEVVVAVDEVKFSSVLERFGDVKIFGYFRIDGGILFVPPFYHGMEVSSSHRVPSGKQRHIPPTGYQSFGDVAGNRPPRAVLPGRCSP